MLKTPWQWNWQIYPHKFSWIVYDKLVGKYSSFWMGIPSVLNLSNSSEIQFMTVFITAAWRLPKHHPLKRVSFFSLSETGRVRRIPRGQWSLHGDFSHKPFWYPKNWPWKKSSCFDTQKYLYSVIIDNVYLERKMLGKFLPNKPSTNGCFFGRSRMEKLRMKQIGIQRWQSMTTTNRWSFNTPPFSTPFPPDVFSKNPPPVLERGHDIMTPSLDKFFWGAQLVH